MARIASSGYRQSPTDTTYPDGIGITDRRRFYTTSRDTTLAHDGGSIQVEHLFRLQHVGGRGYAGVIEPAPLPTPGNGGLAPANGVPAVATANTLDDVIDSTIKQALRETRGNVSAAARILGVSRARLDYRLSKRGRRRAAPPSR